MQITHTFVSGFGRRSAPTGSEKVIGTGQRPGGHVMEQALVSATYQWTGETVTIANSVQSFWSIGDLGEVVEWDTPTSDDFILTADGWQHLNSGKRIEESDVEKLKAGTHRLYLYPGCGGVPPAKVEAIK